MRNIKLAVFLAFAMALTYAQGYAAPPPASQEMGGVERTRELEARSKRLTAQIQKPKKKPAWKRKNANNRPLRKPKPAKRRKNMHGARLKKKLA